MTQTAETFSLLCLVVFEFFFHFKNYRQALPLKQSLLQFNLLDHRHDETLKWEVQNSCPLPSAKPMQEGWVGITAGSGSNQPCKAHLAMDRTQARVPVFF